MLSSSLVALFAFAPASLAPRGSDIPHLYLSVLNDAGSALSALSHDLTVNEPAALRGVLAGRLVEAASALDDFAAGLSVVVPSTGPVDPAIIATTSGMADELEAAAAAVQAGNWIALRTALANFESALPKIFLDEDWADFHAGIPAKLSAGHAGAVRAVTAANLGAEDAGGARDDVFALFDELVLLSGPTDGESIIGPLTSILALSNAQVVAWLELDSTLLADQFDLIVEVLETGEWDPWAAMIGGDPRPWWSDTLLYGLADALAQLGDGWGEAGYLLSTNLSATPTLDDLCGSSAPCADCDVADTDLALADLNPAQLAAIDAALAAFTGSPRVAPLSAGDLGEALRGFLTVAVAAAPMPWATVVDESCEATAWMLGLSSNDECRVELVRSAATNSGGAWPGPLHELSQKALDSTVADMVTALDAAGAAVCKGN